MATTNANQNPTEPQRYFEVRREPHLFMKKLSEAEKSEHARQLLDCEGHIGRVSTQQKELKEFLTRELAGYDPIRLRARTLELKRRNALLAVEKKQYELQREGHLHAAADGYVWITVECIITADDVEQEIICVRSDTNETLHTRAMNETELRLRKERRQLELKGTGTNARGGKA